ncbi:hypothetical protein RJ641_016811 [Dillenia turbinata]|uniref:Uncharacterized protein n=1 Tax=Dillenia turbinata TaxID=194707 RepID=A0AAN8YX43_9MAGN
MESSKSDTIPQQNPQTQSQPPPPKSKKRPLDSNNVNNFQSSSYFKIRALVRDLRPHFLEVIQTKDFKDCKAANEIQEKIKVVMELYKEMTAETITVGKCNNMPEGQILSGEKHHGLKPAEQTQSHTISSKPPEKERTLSPLLDLSEQKQCQDGSSIVGGSAFGWNFITSSGSQAVYYGKTKEAFRAAAVAMAATATAAAAAK